MKNSHLKALTGLGLSENETRVYLSSLALGPAPVLKIARYAGLRRTTVYPTIEALKNRGLMRTEIRGFKKLYAAENPRNLELAIASRKEKLVKILPELLTQYNLGGAESSIKYYEGLKPIKNLYENILKSLRPRDFYLVISNSDLFLNLDSEHFRKFLEKRAKLNLDLRLILKDTGSAHELKKFERNYNAQIRLLGKDEPMEVSILVTPQQIVMMRLTEPLIAFVIEDKSIIQAQKTIFEIVWNSLPEE